MNHYNPKIHHRRSIRYKEYDYSTAGYYFITICCHDKTHRFGKIENETMILNEYGEIALNEWYNLPMHFPDIELGIFQIMPNHIHFIIILVDVTDDETSPVGATLAVAQNVSPQSPTVGAGFTPAQIRSTQNMETVGAGFTPAQIRATQNMETVGAGFTPAQNWSTAIRATARVAPTNMRSINDWATARVNDRATARVAPTDTITNKATVGAVVGGYKSIVMNACLSVYKSKQEIMGKFWQRNYYEHIIRNEKEFNEISNYIYLNPENWDKDSFFNHI